MYDVQQTKTPRAEARRRVRSPRPGQGAIFSAEVSSQEIRIGHLETKDDPDAISSWVFLNCNRNGQQMICDMFQTLISYELRPEQRAAEIEKSMQGDPVKEFRDGFGEQCQQMGQAKDVAMQAIKTGKGVHGRPVNVKEAQDNMPVLNAMADACANPNVNTVRRVIEVFTDRRIRTCKVFNMHSKGQLKWNEQTQNWISQEGPFGECGTININILETDKAAKMGGSGSGISSPFWIYTQKRLFTNPSGVLPNGLGCSKFTEHTSRYSWQTPPTLAECRYIQHVP